MEDKEYIEVHPEYVYLTIPVEYICIYHKLLVYLADYGKTIIDDCTADCKGNSKSIISCWNLFQSALACYTLGDKEKANFFINYIKLQLEHIYKGSTKEPFNMSVPLPITKDGKVKAVVTCCDNGVHFYVDSETGKLYEEKTNKNCIKDYEIENNDLIYK